MVPPVDVAAWRAHLAAPVRGRKVVLGPGPLAGYRTVVRDLLTDGAQRPLVVADGPGTGDPPPEDDADRVWVELPPQPSLSTAIRAEQRLLDELPVHVVEAVDAYDPRGEALWLGHDFVQQTHVLGRPVVGGRPPDWAALEDKTLADALFDAAGVRRPPSEVVAVDLGALTDAAARLDGGAGTVWSGDSRAGINGGGEYVRWVRTPEEAARVVALLAPECDRARVAPFLDGIPCSIHGIVLPDGVVAGRPVELVTLRRPGRSDLLYAGLSTWWDPPPGDRERMRDAVRRVGGHLAGTHGYTGAFGLDGVLTADGWLPTELNPRMSVGLSLVAECVPDLPLNQLQRALVDGREPGIGADDVEALLLPAADQTRTGRARAFVHGREVAPTSVGVTGSPAVGLRVAEDGEESSGSLEVGVSAVGSLVRITPADGALRAGASMAPWAVAAFALADRLWNTGFGPTEAAPDVRRAGYSGGRSS